MKNQVGFTLIELLVVIAIIAILSIVVVLILNPAQLLQQVRDSNRISDLSTLITTVGVYQAQGGTAFGSPNIVYVSIPDPTATSTTGDQCQGLNLISLPGTYTYHCAASSTYRAVNGTGWLPINFTAISSGAPLGQLPIDPINTTSSRNYYTYTTNGTQFEVTAVIESNKYKFAGTNDVIGPDGGALASVYEKGTALGLEPLDYGDPTLVGYWTFEEGTGTTMYDHSGGGLTGTAAGTLPYFASGKIGSYAGNFDGSTNSISCGTNLAALKFSATQSFTDVAWVYPIVLDSAWHDIINYSRDSGNWHGLWMTAGNQWAFGESGSSLLGSAVTINTWHLIVGVQNGDAGTRSLYVDGALVANDNSAQNANGTGSCFIGYSGAGINEYFRGKIDSARLYNRALSPTEITTLNNNGR